MFPLKALKLKFVTKYRKKIKFAKDKSKRIAEDDIWRYEVSFTNIYGQLLSWFSLNEKLQTHFVSIFSYAYKLSL